MPPQTLPANFTGWDAAPATLPKDFDKWDQLAAQHGGSAAVDYDALAAQHGGADQNAPQSTVPVFAPDGTLGDIPAERLMAAVKAGFKPGVHVTSADGKPGIIPADRTRDAVRAGMKIVPLENQPVQHPGFWASLGSDLKDMGKGLTTAAATVLSSDPNDIAYRMNQQAQTAQQMSANDDTRKAEGRGVPYRVGAAANEVLGVNVKGEEQSAKEGDVMGVLGHASAVPVTMAAGAGLSKVAGPVSDLAKSAADRAATAAGKFTPKQVAQVAGGVGGAIAGHNPVSAYFGSKLGHVAEILLGKERANSPIFKQPDLSLPDLSEALAQTIADDRARIAINKSKGLGQLLNTGARPAAETGEALGELPDVGLIGAQKQAGALLQEAVRPQSQLGKELGLIKSTPARSAAESGEALANDPTRGPGGNSAPMPRITEADRAAARSLLQDALKQHTQDVVDRAIPPRANSDANLSTKATVNFFLQRGDLANAESALDAGAKQANPSYEPFGQRQGPVPSTAEIRARVQGKFNAAERLEDQQINEQWQEHFDRNQWSAESEAKREFIARNSTGTTKGQLTDAFRGAAGKATPASDDLTNVLQQSLDAIRSKKQAPTRMRSLSSLLEGKQ